MAEPLSYHFKTEFKRALDVAKLNPSRMTAVAQSPQLTQMAVLFVLMASFAGAFGPFFFPIHQGPVSYSPTFFEALMNGVTASLMVFLSLYLVNLIADRVFHAKGSFEVFFRVVGYGYLVGLLNIFPALNFISSLWILVIVYKVLKMFKHLSARDAVLTLVILAVVYGLLIMLLSGLNPIL